MDDGHPKTFMRREERGFTLLELIITTVLMAVLTAAIVLPRALRSSPRQEVGRAARHLARDLEQVRMRAISAKRKVRVSFDASQNFYTAFMDITHSRSGTISETAEEVRESRMVARGSSGGLPGVVLPKSVNFGAGAASTGPLGAPISGDPIALPSDRVELDARGMVTPLGSAGTVYLSFEGEPSAVAAVTISGAGAFQAWRYRDSEWER